MYRRTFEIWAKMISKEHKVGLAFDMDGGAHADMKADVLHLPKEIANDNACGALALASHEAAHIRYSKGIPIQELAPMQTDHFILNAVEDIRIDRKNFQVFPHMRDFYEQLVKKSIDLTDKKIPENQAKVCGAILELEGFSPKVTKKNREWSKQVKFNDIFERGVQELESQDWKAFKKTIAEIKKLLKIDPKQDQPNKATTMTGDPVNGEQGQAAVQGIAVPGKAGKDASPSGANDLQGINGILHPSSTWGTGERMPGGSSMATSPLAMDEQCAQQFKEILNIKEIKIIEEGATLDTDNLISLYTGDINTLFKHEKTVRNKKSKVMFLMDASGSMSDPLVDKNPRYAVVKSCVQKLTEILNEVQAIEGLNVDWSISQFDNQYTSLTKDNWQNDYRPSGGTSFINGFDGAFKEMLADYSTEGKRIIVAFSDGDIGDSEIEYVQNLIRKHFTDVRMLIIGVGSDLSKKFVKDVVGDNVISFKENAVEIIMNVIAQML